MALVSSVLCLCSSNLSPGCLLLKRKIYQNEKGKAYLCLGFRSYAALGFPLERVKLADKDQQ